MSLVIDGSSPAVATGVSSATTASFTPPDGALLLVAFSGNSVGGSNPAAPTITDNLGVHLTYTLLDWASRADNSSIDGQAALWWAQVGTGAAMTVTVDGSHETAAKVWVITGHDPGAPIGVHAKVGSTSAAAIAQSYTASATSSQGFIAVCDWTLVGNETAGSGCTMDATGNVGAQFNYGFARRTADDGSIGVSTSLNVTLPGTSTDLWWCYCEVLPEVVNPEALDPPPFVIMRPMGFGAPNFWLNPWLGAPDAPSQPITMKVTATQSGSVFNGMGMSVKMLTGQAATQNGASNQTNTITTPNLAITPNASGSWVYGALLNANGTTAWTANANSTFALNFSDVADGSVYGNYRSTATTTAATPVTLGASAPTGQLTGGLAQAEILSSTGLVEEVASPPAVTSATTTISSATFTCVPGSLLVATICSDGAAGTVTIAVSGGALTWTEVVKANATGKGYAGVWIAQVPGSATADVRAQTGVCTAAAAPSGTAARVAPAVAASYAGAVSVGVRQTALSRAGSTYAGVASSAAAVKVASVAGRCAAGAAPSGVARKVAPAASVAAAGTSSTGAARKVRSLTAAALAGAAGAGAGRKVVADTGRACVGTAASGAPVKRATPASTAICGASPTGTARKVAGLAGAVFAAAEAFAGTAQVRAQTGACAGGGSAAGAAKGIRLPSGRAAAAAAAAGVAKTVRARAGAAAAGAVSRAAAATVRPRTATSAAGGCMHATAAGRRPAAGRAFAAAATVGVAIHGVPPPDVTGMDQGTATAPLLSGTAVGAPSADGTARGTSVDMALVTASTLG